MDDSSEGFLLIVTSMIVMLTFAVTVLAVMVIYRRRKLEHEHEIALLNEKFTRDLLTRQIEIQQMMMELLGQEVHDNLGQQLTLATLYLQHMQPSNELEVTQVKRVRETIAQCLASARSLAHELINPDEAPSDLVSEVHQICEKANQLGSVKTQLTTNASNVRVNAKIRIFTTRILQEFIQNSLRHSGCDIITVELLKQHDEVVMRASDNGKGFDVSKRNPVGVGLKNMEQRAAMINSTLTVASSAAGTTMDLHIPITNFANEA